MEVINFEKFLYFNKCELNIVLNGTKKIEKQKVNFLFTLNSIYFFGDHPDNKTKTPEEVELEKNLICKANHDQFYISSFDDQLKNITFTCRVDDLQIALDIKDLNAKDFKDFVNVCLIMDGYKLITENYNLDYSSYSEYLFHLIESLIINSGSLIIHDDFFSIDYNFLTNLANFFTRIDRLVVKVNLFDLEVIKIFNHIFESSKLHNGSNIISEIPKLQLIKVLTLNNNDLNDQGFEILSNLLKQTEFLTELEISNNHITNISLQELSNHISLSLKLLEKLNLSNNSINSYILDEFVILVLENLPKLTHLDLSGNSIDNEFLKKIDFNYFRKVCFKYEFNEVVIDLCRNRFDTHLHQNDFYLWKFEEEFERPDKAEKRIYTLDHFLQNATTMKLKLKFKIDLIKHFKQIKDMDFYKKQMEGSKCVKIYCKTTQSSENNSELNKKTEIEEYQQLFSLFYLIDQFFDPNLNNFNNKDPIQNINTSSSYLNNSNRSDVYLTLTNYITQNIQLVNIFTYYTHNNLTGQYNNIQMVVANTYYTKNINRLIKTFFDKDAEDFNPNVVIEDLNDLFIRLKSFSLEISYVTIHKLINRIKIETLLSLKDKDLYSIKFLAEMNSFFKLSYMEKTHSELISLNDKSEIIIKALASVLNFEGNSNKDKFFIHEVNNFLDFFIKEADEIKIKNNIINVAKYVQFLRNNKLRISLYSTYENLLKEENLFSGTENILSEFDLIYKKYYNIRDFVKLRVPDNVNNKILALHPNKLDYLKLSEVKIEELQNDLKIVSRKLVDEESYGIRNIHDRIHFILTHTSDEYLDKNNKYQLYKQNDFLRVTRILLRYFNNTDLKKIKENFQIDYIVNLHIKDIIKEYEKFSNSERNSILNFSKLKNYSNVKANPNPNPHHKDNNLKNINLDYTPKLILEYKKKILSHNKSPITESLINASDDLKPEEEEQFNFIAIHISERLYQILDKNFSEDGNTILNLGQICNNIKNFLMFFLETKEQYYKTNYKLYDLINQEIIVQFYRHANRNEFTAEKLSINITNCLKKWLNYLISKNYYTDYCKKIQKNLINHSNIKLLWVPSIFEIESRLENQPIVLKIHFDKIYWEEFTISERTTVCELYDRILESKYFSEITEKRLYWIYIKHFKINENVPLFSEEYILDAISFLEENYLNNIDYLLDESAGSNNKLKKGNRNEKTQSFIFLHIEFNIQRRLFSPAIISSDFSYLHPNEILIIFEGVKTQFLKGANSINISDGDTINLCADLFEIEKRHSGTFENNKTLEENILTNLPNITPKFKKNVINNNLENFIIGVKQSLERRNLAGKSEKDLKEEFLINLKNYEVFFSNIYQVKNYYSDSNEGVFPNSNNFILPDTFLIMINLNFIIFLDKNKLEPILRFNYYNILYCTFVTDSLYLAFITDESNKPNKNKPNTTKEIRLKLTTDDSRLIMEDILSYAQLYLAINTESSFTKCNPNTKHDLLLECRPAICDMINYQFIFQRRLPFMNIVPSIIIDLAMIEQNRRTSAQMRNSMLKNHLGDLNVNVKQSEDIINKHASSSSQAFLSNRKNHSLASLEKIKSNFGLEEESKENIETKRSSIPAIFELEEKVNSQKRGENYINNNKGDNEKVKYNDLLLKKRVSGVLKRSDSPKKYPEINNKIITNKDSFSDNIIPMITVIDNPISNNNSNTNTQLANSTIPIVEVKKPNDSVAMENTKLKLGKAMNIFPFNSLELLKK